MLSRFLTLFLVFFASVAGAQTPVGSVAGRDARVWSADPDDYAAIDAETWRAVRLVLPWDSGAVTTIDLLRPAAWVALHGARPGSEVFIDAGELGVRGHATVVSVGPCPPLAELPAGHRHVIGRFVTTDAEVLDLAIEGLGGPVGVTATHPLWSEDRSVWVRAGDLEPGERLRTAGGWASVESITPRPERETVYNLQLHRDHTFYVTDANLWAHNCNWSGIDYENHVRSVLGSRGSFSVAGREFDGRSGGLWFEVKSAAGVGFSEWERLKNQLGSQAAIARQNGRQFALFTPGPVPRGFEDWLASKGIIHRVLP